MQMLIVATGKIKDPLFVGAIEDYAQRIRRKTPLSIVEIPSGKQETSRMLQQLNPQDTVVLLDEKGKSFSSVAFANWLEGHRIQSVRRLVFVLGGAYGFDASLYQRANHLLSLSPMTFAHKLARLVFMEQLYRAHAILDGDPYHHS